MLREHSYHRRVDKRPGPDIPSRVEIGIRGVAAMVADKYRLAFSVGFLAVPTGRTGAAGVAWVYEQDRNPCQRRLIGDKAAELPKGPSGVTTALDFANRCPPLANARQVFEGKRRVGAFGLQHQLFADAVVHVTAKRRLTLADLRETTASAFGADLVENAPTPGIPLPGRIYGCPRKELACRIGCQIDYPQVHAYHIVGGDGCLFRHVDGAEQVQLPLPSHQVRLPLDTSLPGTLVGATHKGHMQPSRECPQAHLVEPLEAQDALIVTDSRVGFKRGAYRFIALKAFDRLRNRPHRHLRRQAKPLADRIVGQMVNGDLPKHTSRKAGVGGKRRGSIEARHSVQQRGVLFGRRQQVELQGQFHAERITCFTLIVERILAHGHLSSSPA
jgi:hypothetical protein